MNRRNFIRNSALALFGFTVLPPAETYQRVWRASPIVLQYRGNALGVYEQLRQCTNPDILADVKTKLDLEDFFNAYYQVQKARSQSFLNSMFPELAA
jgi:hypothetical protein